MAPALILVDFSGGWRLHTEANLCHSNIKNVFCFSPVVFPLTYMLCRGTAPTVQLFREAHLFLQGTSLKELPSSLKSNRAFSCRNTPSACALGIKISFVAPSASSVCRVLLGGSVRENHSVLNWTNLENVFFAPTVVNINSRGPTPNPRITDA